MPLLIEENFTAVLCERLKRGELDAVIISLPFDEPGILTRPLYDEPFALLLPARHALVEREAVDIADLAGENVLLLGPGHCFRDQVLQACPQCLQQSAANGSLQRSLEGGSLETIRYMVASGVGVTVLPCSAALAEPFAPDVVSVRPFRGQAPRRRVALAWRRSFPRVEAVEVLARAICLANLDCVTYLKGGR
jgi:LysR family hydrogen peroxide-inducible transcriptional activator